MKSFKLKFGIGMAVLIAVFLISQGIYRRNIVILHNHTQKIIAITEQMHAIETFHSSIHEMLILTSQYTKDSKQGNYIEEQYAKRLEEASASLKKVRSRASNKKHADSHEDHRSSLSGLTSNFELFQNSLDGVFLNPADKDIALTRAKDLFDTIFQNYYLMIHGHHSRELSEIQKSAHDIKSVTDIYFLAQLGISLMVGIAILYYFDRVVLKLYAVTEQLSIKDALTSLYNRQYLSKYIDREIARSVRYKTPFSVAMIDIDNFKKFNDTYGHPAGDKLLKDISVLMKKCVRNIDVVVRYGGEEFLIIFLETDKPAAIQTAQRILTTVSSHAFQLPVPVTVSIGVSAFSVDGTAWDEVLKKADDRLYKAKNQGKNRVRGE